ncbi:MAG: DUF1549 domain-containing protein, partial [Isosphaerales bacterium]
MRIFRHCIFTWFCLAGFGSAAAAQGVPDRIEVEPSVVRLAGAEGRQQIAITGRFTDGSCRDLTAEAHLAVEPAEVAMVSPSGVVTPIGNGQAVLRVTALGRDAEVPVHVVDSARRSRPVSYRLDVSAVLSKAGCNMGTCHGNLNGKGGLKLSLRGEDPGFDLDMLVRHSFGRRIDRNDPDQSLLLKKATGRVPHEGGLRFPAHSPEADTLRAWIAAGPVDDKATAPKLVGLTVWPPERMIAAPGLSQQLVVTARFADGSRRDVTRQASYEMNEPLKASLTPDGHLKVNRPTEIVVAARYLNQRGVSRLAVLADRPDFVWRGPEPKNVIDRHVFAKLKALRVNPSPETTDAAFLRRAYLDALGVLPTADEARTFLADSDAGKRGKLVDRLLERPEFADFWALKWADLLRVEERTMGLKGVWGFQRWLRDQITRDVPLDVFAGKLISSTGSTYANPPASFHRTNRDPMTAAEAVGQVFLGYRLQCARCHNHPFDDWTQDDYYGLAAYFGNVRRKDTASTIHIRFDVHGRDGDEIVYLASSALPRIVQPRSGALLSP